MTFINDSFLLTNDKARHLYNTFAKNEPILDYHCHLPPKDIAENRRFANLFEIWLEGDHYKWRAMRSNGVAEPLCTGDAPAKDKFMAWAATVPHTLRNPLYHWTHLELKRYFGIDELLSPTTAESIWNRTSELLASDQLSVHGILNSFHVKAVCTTDDPADALTDHERIASSGLSTRVYPTFRPDKAFLIDQPPLFNAWLDKLAATANTELDSLDKMLDALSRRHADFHALGGRLSDHGLCRLPAGYCDEREAAHLFDKARGGTSASPEEQDRFTGFLMLFFGRLDASRGWTKQMHVGARRNNNTRLYRQLGPDTGFDSIGDWEQGDRLGTFLDLLDRENALPKTILYNLNPSDNYLFATMIGNFQDGSVPGKIQWGSGWWFLD
ncbi:MAG: glucuronate isomerase, partial [Planctomycetales bacterium]|nr:glucuronate isomerase [Planctomycetales bacterium]